MHVLSYFMYDFCFYNLVMHALSYFMYYFTFDNVTGDLMIAAKGNIDRETIGSSLSYTIQAADMCKH